MAPDLPRPRGPLSDHLTTALRRPPHTLGLAPAASDDPLTGDDFHLALYLSYELHYRGFAGVDDGWEWEPSLLAFRARLERAFEAALRAESPVGPVPDVVAALQTVAAGDGGPSLSTYMLERGSVEEMREFAIHRSAYQLKEADPHTWGIPRLSGAVKAAMVEIQMDEYGGGVPGAMHSQLFEDTLAALGLEAGYGHYLDLLPGVTLATTNLISFLGLHRRLRGALVGHLALFEMTSVGPMGRYAAALRRMGAGEAGSHFYDVHVAADTHHQAVALFDLAAGLAAQEPDLAADIVFGAKAISEVEGRFAGHLLASWATGRSSLLAAQVPATVG